MAEPSDLKYYKNICRNIKGIRLKTSLVKIASAVERIVLPVDPNFEKDQTNDAE